MIGPALGCTVGAVSGTATKIPYGVMIWDGHLIAVERDNGGWDWHVVHPATCTARCVYPLASEPGLSWVEYDCVFEQQISAIGPDAFGDVDDSGWPEDIPRVEGLFPAGYMVEKYMHWELGPEYDVFLTVCRHRVGPSCR